jgi:tetratricopeptide (TPR) repeat protein
MLQMIPRTLIRRTAPLTLLLGLGCTGTNRPDLNSILSTSSKATITPAKPPTGANGTINKPTDLPDQESAALMLTMAKSLDSAGKDEEALIHYEKARAITPKFPDESLQRIAVLYDKLGDQPKALAILRELRDRYPGDANVLNDLGYSLYNRGEWAEAESVLRQATQKDPKHTRAWMNLGLTLAQLERTEEAYAAFTRAVSPADAHANIAFIYLSRKQPDAARKHYQTALELEPQHRLARKMLDRMASQTGS